MKTILYTIKNFAKRVVMALVAVLMASNVWGVTYTKVTDVGSLAAGDEILIVSEHANKAISTTQNTNNRAAQAVTISSSTITDPSDVQVITLEASSTNWKFKVGTDAYLYAASSSKNYLRTETSTNAGSDGIWSISITDGNATIRAQGDNTNNLLQYNNNNTLFSCYGSTQSNGAVQIYKKGSSTFTVDFAVSPAGYGTVSPSAQLTGITSGTTITTSSNTVTINGTTVTATPHAQDADYNYAFSSWSVTDNLTTVTKNITVTANFLRTPRGYKNYRTACCSEWTPPSLSGYSTSLTAGGATTTISVSSGTTYGAKTCESSNPDVLTVTNAGVITPVGAGTATVTVHWAGDATHCEEEVTTSTITVTGNVTVTFKKNGGDGTDNQTQSIPVSTSTALKTLAQLGYTAPSCKRFKGWATSEANANAGTVAYDTDGMNITVTEATTLWASWEYIPYTVARGSGTATGCDGGTFTFSPSTVDCGGTVTITSSPDATHKGDPTITILPAGNGTVVGNTITNVIGNITSISVSYAAKESYTVTLNPGNGSLAATGSWSLSGDNLTQTVLEGNNVTAMPAATPGCSGWAFVGWKQGSAANDQVSFIPDKSAGDVFSPAANVTYYAVYRQNAAGGTTYNKITNIGDLTTGNYVIVASLSGGYAMNNGDIVWDSSGGYYRMAETGSAGTGESITTSNAEIIWTIIKLGSNYAIKSGSKYVGIDKDGILVYDTDIHFFTASYNGSSNRWEFTSTEDPSSQLVYSTYFRSMDTQNTAILLYKQGASGTGNYFSSPTCSDYTVTGVANPAAGGSVTLSATSAKEGEKVYAMCTPNPAYNFTNWTISGTGVSPTTSTNQIVEITVGAGNVTATANFAEKVVYTVAWNVNNANYTTYTGAGTLSTSAESGTQWSALTLPDNPADNTLSACERTKFVGWSTSPLTGDGKSAPADLFKSTSDASATSHTITGNTTFYAVFAKGGNDDNWVVNGSNLDQLDPSNASTYGKYNGDHTLSGIIYNTADVCTNSTNLQFKASSGTLYNKTAMPADITSIVLTVNTLRVYQNSSVTSSSGALTPITPTGSGPYTYTFTAGNRYFLIKEPDSGASYSTVTVNYAGEATDFVTSCACSWNINYITNGKKDGDGAAIWSEDNCFQQVSTTHEWQIEDFAMPNVAGQFWVGPGYFKGSGDWGHSVIADLSTVKYVLRSDKTRTSYSAVSNMIGTLNVWDNGGDDNYHVGIYPDYQITYGVDGGSDPWSKVDFNYISGTTYETEVVTAPTYFAVANFKYYVGVKTDGNTGYGGKSNTVMMNTMSGMTSSQDGKHGKWRMYENSGDPNWYCAWVPYYVLSYDANGGTGAPSAEAAVSSEDTQGNRTKIVSSTIPTRDGYTFIGWNTQPGGGGTSKSAGDNIVLTSDVVLYAQWAQNFTLAYNLDGGEADPACDGGTKYVGQHFNVCSSTPTRLSSSFNGWKANVAISSAGGTNYSVGALIPSGTELIMPASNVTLTADYTTVYWHITYHDESDANIVGISSDKKDVPQGMSITLPSPTPCVGFTFYGWSTSKITNETTTKPTGATFIGKGGASYTPTADVTVYPVYARVEGASDKNDVITKDINGGAGSYTAFSNVSYVSDAKYAGCTNTQSSTDLAWNASNGVVTTVSGGRIKHVQVVFATACTNPRSVYVYGKNTAYSTFVKDAFPTGAAAGTLIATATKTTTMNTGEVTVELPAEDEDFEDEYNYIALGADNAIRLTSVKVTWSTGTTYYATHCETKTDVTVTYNGNGGTVGCGTPAGGEVTSVTWAYKNGGEDAPELASSQTICASATRSGYILHDWTTSQDGSGTHYVPGATITELDGDKTLYAQWDRVYTVNFVDHGLGSGDVNVSRTQASLGASVSVPSATTPCVKAGITWTFAGWGTVDNLSQSLAHHIVIPTGTSTYTPTDDITLYAVYRKAIGTSDAFAIGTSGAYKISVQQSGNTCYATVKNEGGTSYYCSTTVGEAGVFYLTYVNSGANQGKYTLQNSDGEYIGHTLSSPNLTHSLVTPEYYNLVDVSSTGWRLQYANETDRYFSHGSLSSDYNYSAKKETNKCTLTPADRAYYYTTMSCDDDMSITFHENGGTITWKLGHAESTYEHLADGTEISVFPTAAYEGWTFLGWRTANYPATGETTDAPEALTTYGGSDGESGYAFTIHSNTDMYPVFTRFEDNEQIDLVNGGDYFIYFLQEGSDDGYGGERRVYAKEYGAYKHYNSTTLCEEATEFTFTKLANGNWTIKDKTTNSYLYGIEDDDLKQKSTPDGAEWTLTLNGNQFDAFHVGTSYGQLIANGNGTSATFMNYRRTNITTNPSLYHRVYLGSCTNRVFSTNPSNTPEIDLKGTAVVTSSQNGAIRATGVLSVSGNNLTPSSGTITISSNNSDIYFSTSQSASFASGIAAENNPKSTITLTANSSGMVNPQAIYVHYKPASNADAVTSVTVTAISSDGAPNKTTTVTARKVKENFVIAAKVAESWYALPADMSSGSVYEPTLIDVDETNNIAYGPSTVAYKLWPVKTVNSEYNRYENYGDKVRFTGNSDHALWANNAASGTTTNIRNWAVVNSIDDGGDGSDENKDERYEWVLSSTDGETYSIRTDQSNNKRELVIYRPSNGAHAGKLVWASNSTYETNEIHFFPLTEREVITIIPREWKANGLVFSVAADNQITAASYKIGTGSETSTTYTRHSTGGYGLYEVALPDLTSQYGKLLTLKLTISGTPTYATTTIPIIVNANASTKTNEPFATLGAATKDYDVVVLDGKTLTTDAASSGACNFQNLYLYAGSTLVNAANNNLSVRYLELRGGIKGIDHKSDLAQGVPHLKLDKNFSSTAGANLDMCVNTAHSYALSVPFDVTLSTVNFANSLNTTTSEPINGTLDAQFMIMEYDGAQRASTGKGWKHITSTERVLHAGEGYVLQGKRPKGQPFAVIRFPFSSVTGWADGSGEVTKSAVSISEHAGGASTPDNDKGWNLIANPYMATLSYNGADEGWAADFTVGSLVKTDTDPWDGKYEWTSTTNAYVTIPNEWYTEFPQYRANSAQAVFEPFKNFFIQASANGSVTFDKSKRASAPRYLLAQTTKAQPIYADINLIHGEAFAQAGLTVDENATAGYKFGEDQNIFENRNDLTYLKVYTVADGHYLVGNTMTPAETAEMIPLEFYAPNAEGEYIFSLDDNSDIDRLEYVILYDAVLGLNTNLLTDDYTVELDETGLIENRFSIGLKIKEKEDSATGVDNVNSDKERPFKFIYQDKLYILQNGIIYDAVGKKVSEINK